MSSAYYNEHDPFAAAWLRELIKAGLIAPGDVDERSIEDVVPSELVGYTQCHFFAGIGVWSYALRRAGWRDDRPVWTGSCPCQPFSAAGKGAGFDDERHLWPAFNHLIAQCKPPVVFGEQVASKAVDAWIDLVHADLEAVGYAFGSVPFPSAGVGAPHIRDRNFWVGRLADSESYGYEQRIVGNEVRTECKAPGGGQDEGCGRNDVTHGSMSGGLENPELPPQPRQRPDGREIVCWQEAGGLAGAGVVSGLETIGSNTGLLREGELGGVADAADSRPSEGRIQRIGQFGLHPESGRMSGDARNGERSEGVPAATEHTGPTNGFWRDADWLFCRDGKWRPVEPGTFPLVNGAAARVGRLRGFGNAINAEAATAFIEAWMK